jgi:hypothetical protein
MNQHYVMVGEKMKIGILTWFYGSNYGAKAQSYALQQVLKSFGVDVFMIDYRHKNYKRVNKKMNYDYTHIKFHPFRFYRCIKKNKILSNTNYLYNLTKRVAGAEAINSLNLDVIILGSDAIFNINHPFYDPLYMGVGINLVKIAYSPSCENLSPDFVLSDKEVESLKSFKKISVRDYNTQALLEKNINKKPLITCDPTILYDFNEIEFDWKYQDYILVYSFSEWNEYAAEIRKFANNHRLSIISVGRYCVWADVSIEDASFEQWVVSFKFATYVFTDSFHGTVFALKNSKNLIMVSREDKRAKIESLLDDVGVNRRFLLPKESVDLYVNRDKINYLDVRKKLGNLKEKSIEYLKNALEL